MIATAAAGGATRLVAVTGMHRSGTSLGARAVNLLGVSFGAPEVLMAPGPDNPAGYWEHRGVKELDDELLARLGGSWDQPPVLERGWMDRADLDDLLDRARHLVAADLVSMGSPVVGFKDPRLSVLLAFWRRAVVVDQVVAVVRNPREVVASLANRNRFDVAEAATLWLRYVLALRADAPGAVVVLHRDLVDDLPATLVRLARDLDLPAPEESTIEQATRHLDRSLVHHSADTTAAMDHPVLALADRVWDGGRLDPGAVDPSVSSALGEGWLGAPGNRDRLQAARARAVDLEERLRKRLREVRSEQLPTDTRT